MRAGGRDDPRGPHRMTTRGQYDAALLMACVVAFVLFLTLMGALLWVNG